MDHVGNSHDLHVVIGNGVVAALETWSGLYSRCGVVDCARGRRGGSGHGRLAKLSGVKAESGLSAGAGARGVGIASGASTQLGKSKRV